MRPREEHGATTQSLMTLSIMGFFVTLSINDTQHNSIECHCAKLNVDMLSISMLNVIALSVSMLSIAMLNVVEVAPEA